MSAKDYLWEKKGTPDAETKELEALLGGARFSGMELPVARPRRRKWIALAGGLAAAAAITFALVPRGPFFEVRDAAGNVAKLYVDRWVETKDESARIRIADIGEVEVRPGSRMRLKRTDSQEHRMELTRGSVHAVVDAPPRLFVIDTPAATAVDLGCEYDLTVEENGSTRLEVRTGWVALEGSGKQSIVPAGMGAVTRAGMGPGTPVKEDAPTELRAAIDRFDLGEGAALSEVLERTQNAVTLWHLLARAAVDRRAEVYERLERRVPNPGQKNKAIALEKKALDGWWEAIAAQ